MVALQTLEYQWRIGLCFKSDCNSEFLLCQKITIACTINNSEFLAICDVHVYIKAIIPFNIMIAFQSVRKKNITCIKY
jgi:hypothetical protein